MDVTLSFGQKLIHVDATILTKQRERLISFPYGYFIYISQPKSSRDVEMSLASVNLFLSALKKTRPVTGTG